MGIVVSVFMLLGLLMALPWVPAGLRRPGMADVVASGLLLTGLWNLLWYGLRHLSEFWGVAAFGSGLVMILVAVLLLVEHGSEAWRRRSLLVWAHSLLKPLAIPLMIGLALCFVTYATALVRLNLGLPIPN